LFILPHFGIVFALPIRRRKVIQRKEIFCDNPLVEIWKHLRLLTDISTVSEIIVSEHFQGMCDEVEKNRKNISKQAEQVSFCIRQAEEYFDSSNVVGLATKPLLLYYGATSLATALSLIRKGGEQSLDVRRKTPNANHHGLEIFGDVASLSRRGVAPTEFFKGVGCKVYVRDNVAVGAFPLYYDSLETDVVSIPATTTFTDAPFSRSGVITLPCADKTPLSEISKRSISLLDAMAGLPDLVDDLERLSLPTMLRRCKYTLATRHPMNLETIKESDEVVQETHDLFVYGMSTDDEAFLQTHYAGIKNSQHLSFEKVESGTLRGMMSRTVTKSGILNGIYFPDVVDASSAALYLILKPKEYIPELAAMLMVLYILGMLCRYYPDIWIKMIDRSAIFSETINSVLRTVRRRFPNLILNQVRQVKYVFQK
jgi:hypothetical protein